MKIYHTTNFSSKVCQRIRLTATPIKDMFNENIKKVVLIPLSPDYQGLKDCESFGFQILDRVEHIKYESKSKHVVIEKLSQHDFIKLFSEMKNTHFICEMTKDGLFLHYTSHEQLGLIQNVKGFQKENDKDYAYFNKSSIVGDILFEL